jgi:hypothetical protein
MGERVPGREPVTRDDHEERLRRIARLMAQEKARDWQRHCELERQFRALADRIELAQAKREWVIREEAWYASGKNAPPEMADLWVGPTANPSMFKRPKPWDFDPDPKARRRREPLPEHVLADPYSIRNMLIGLREAGLNVYLSRAGDPPWDRGALLVRLPMKGRAQFVLAAHRDERGMMVWEEHWDGNYTEAGLKRLRATREREDVRRMREVLKFGRRMPVCCDDLLGGCNAEEDAIRDDPRGAQGIRAYRSGAGQGAKRAGDVRRAGEAPAGSRGAEGAAGGRVDPSDRGAADE